MSRTSPFPHHLKFVVRVTLRGRGSGFAGWPRRGAGHDQSRGAKGKAAVPRVLCFVPGKAKFEGYQNKGLQKGAALARGILLYELSRFGRMEKITQKPRQEHTARGGRARCTSRGWPLPPALLDTDPGVGGTQAPYFVRTEVPPA